MVGLLGMGGVTRVPHVLGLRVCDAVYVAPLFCRFMVLFFVLLLLDVVLWG